MNKQINIKEILDWYIWAGVDVTCSDEGCLSATAETSLNTDTAPVTNNAQNSNQTSVSKQSVSNILKNARDVCAQAQSLDELKDLLCHFEGCSLKNTAASTVFGDGDAHAKIMLIGEAPGADEDRQGKPFVGRCGKLLDKILEAVHIERKKCYITNVLPWRPPGNRSPSDDEIAVCLPFLIRQIELIKPDYILLMGGIALKSVMNISDSISRTRGKWLEYNTTQGNSIVALATYHPSYLLRSSAQKSKVWADMLRFKKKIEELS